MAAAKPGAIIHRSSLPDGREVVIRYVKASDAPAMVRYINALSKERTFVTFQGEQMTLQKEKAAIAKYLRWIGEKKGLLLLLCVDEAIAGVSTLNLHDRIHSHVGTFGISLAKPFRGRGLGRLFMQGVLREAAKLPGLRIIALDVFGTNRIARSLYRSFGFKEYGTLPGGIRHRGRYVDEVFMYKKVK